MGAPLDRAQLPVGAVELARFLIGRVVVREHEDGLASGRIVETEAYLVGDAACHAFRGPTVRNASLFLGHGHAYVYLVYGCWWALNVAAEPTGIGAGVLIRALEPIEGVLLMQRRRGVTRLLDLARGPGRLATALAVDRSLDGFDLCVGGALRLEDATRPVGTIGVSTRIGLSVEIDRRLRFFEHGSRFVSGPRGLSA